MPTDNRRVATYLPPELDTHFKAFIAERNLKGDSLALITILSEYFQVTHSVGQKVDYSGFVKIEQFQELAARVDELSEQIEKGSSVGSLLSKLPDKMRQIAARLEKVESFATLLPPVGSKASPDSLDTAPGQMDLLEQPEPVESESKPLSSLNSELNSERVTGQAPEPLSGTELAHRFGVHEKLPTNKRSVLKDDQKFAEWTKSQDPDGIAWRYDSNAKGKKKFVPISAETSDQDNPVAPQGSERSEEG